MSPFVDSMVPGSGSSYPGTAGLYPSQRSLVAGPGYGSDPIAMADRFAMPGGNSFPSQYSSVSQCLLHST